MLAVLRPAERWHWWLHAYVVVVASWYWISSLWLADGASFAELMLYRPGGDAQLYPIIRSLSRFNLGDPVDALRYGEGIVSFPVFILLPHALACAALGPAGYVLTDALMPWCYFLAAQMLLRQCHCGLRASVALAALMATGGLHELGQTAARLYFFVLHHGLGVSIWHQGWPNLAELTIYGPRIHRPQVTEIFLVLALYLLVRLWCEPRRPTAAHGLLLGAVLGLLFQGDLYAVAALGLLAIAVFLRASARERWRAPWEFVAGGFGGALLVGWMVIVQRLTEHPDIAGRFGLVDYTRWPLLLLPRFGWLVRVGAIVLLAGFVRWVARRHKDNSPFIELRTRAGELAVFLPLLMLAAAFAQPIQILLTGKAIQTYHYYHNLAVFYSYGAVILLSVLVRVLVERFQLAHGALGGRPRWRRALLVVVLVVGAWLGTDTARRHHRMSAHPQGASAYCQPWAQYGDRYRPALRELDEALREYPAMRQARTFATYNQDVFILLTAFHDKRAFNPDAFASTLGDEELEDRLMTAGLWFQLATNNFHPWLSQYHILNGFLGCNKYRFASDYRFSPDPHDYPQEKLEHFKDPLIPLQDGWILILPNSEGRRLTAKYMSRPPRLEVDSPILPDLLVLCPKYLERPDVFAPHPALYGMIFENEVFTVYQRLQ